MELSKHNIFSKINNSDNYLLLNVLHGQADILDPDTAAKYIAGSFEQAEMFTQKGYLVNPEVEEKLYAAKYRDFIKNRESEEIQLFFVPWYTCNFNCAYCYQDEYGNKGGKVDYEIAAAFFTYINNVF